MQAMPPLRPVGQGRFAALATRWRQLSTLHKVLALSTVGLVLIVALLWQSGSVDAARVRPWHGAGGDGGGGGGRPLAGGVPIRLMFVGASMTLGEPRDSGYRQQVRAWLVGRGHAVNCVGANRFGAMKDNDVQAWGAQPIRATLDRARDVVPATQPNLVLVNAGSSDCFQEQHWGSAHAFDHTWDLTQFLLDASPRAAVVLSTVITNPRPWNERCVKSVNAQIRQVAADMARAGRHVALAEMHWDQGLPGRPNVTDIQADQMHPTQAGWFMMGEIFIEAIREVEAKGWLRAPVDNGVPADGDAERDAEERQKAQEEEAKAAAAAARPVGGSGVPPPAKRRRA